MARKSLGEQIAERAQPTRDFDIEDEENGHLFSDELGSDALEDSDDEQPHQHYVKVQKSKIRGNEPLVTDEKYHGAITDRKALFEDESPDQLNDESQDSEGNEEDVHSDEDSEDESEEFQSANNTLNPPRSQSGSEDEADAGEQSEDEELENSNDESDSDADSSGSDNEASRKEKIKAMMAKERKHLLNRLSQSGAQDALKGYAVLQQQKLFDSVIDIRLKIQKAVTNSNMLPGNGETLENAGLSTDSTNDNLRKAADSCYDLLDRIHALRSGLFLQEKIVSEPVRHEPKKRSLDQYLQTAEKFDTILIKYRGDVLNKWLAKIQNSSGSSAISGLKFKALNQSAEQQVNNNLADMDRLVKRTRLNRRKITPLGHDYYEEHFENGNGADDEQNDAEENPDVPKIAQSRQLNVQELATIFDDEDFYRVLLNDLVDKKIQLNDPTSGVQFAMRGAASTKLKKNVDNKASKGRRLRYEVQEPIANFETPLDHFKWSDEQMDDLFASLLGQKITMNEEERSGEAEKEDEDEEELIANDGITLFG